MKKLLSLLLASLMLLCAVSAFAEEDTSLDAILEKGKLVLGLDDSFPPMGFRDEDNNIIGFDIDLATEVCSRLGVELVLQPIEWAAKDLELSSGNIDCIWNGMSITDERLASMSMSDSYMNNKMVFFAKVGSGIASAADLAGKAVAVQSGSYAEEILAGLMETSDEYAAIGEVLAYEDYLTALMDVENGNADTVLIDLVVANYKIVGMGVTDLEQVLDIGDDNYGIGFRKADVALRDKVNALLKEMAADGTMAEISTKWFGSDITTIVAD
ncbi:MAG: amino acid ABC transporter substrate-binding protein [Christensenellales bacterium]|jgi:polar amino acid transport system substrate-binding protein